MAKLNKVAGAEESCPSCHEKMTCVELPAVGNYPSRLQWQSNGKAHYSFDPTTNTTSCKPQESAGVGNIMPKKATSEEKLENMKAFAEFVQPIAMKMSSEFIDTIKGKLDVDSEIDIQDKQIETYQVWVNALSNVYNC